MLWLVERLSVDLIGQRGRGELEIELWGRGCWLVSRVMEGGQNFRLIHRRSTVPGRLHLQVHLGGGTEVTYADASILVALLAGR